MGTGVGTLTVEQLGQQAIVDSWPSVCGHLMRHKEVWEDTTDFQGIFEDLMRGELQLFVGLDTDRVVQAVVMTRIVPFYYGRAFQIVWIEGKEPALIATAMDWMENLAKSLDCFRLEVVSSRNGWQRVLKNQGYKEVYRVLGRTIDPTLRKDH